MDMLGVTRRAQRPEEGSLLCGGGLIIGIFSLTTSMKAI